YILVTLLRDLKGRPYRVLLEFTFKFIKEILTLVRNTFLLPKIIFNNLCGPLTYRLRYIFLLRILFCDRAFALYNLISKEELSRLYIPLGRNKLLLPLNRKLDKIPVLRQPIKTLNS
ncbi:uncharacterized protein BDZ99DRAFT_388358, partial [Mytilinidion resinicola]